VCVQTLLLLLRIAQQYDYVEVLLGAPVTVNLLAAPVTVGLVAAPVQLSLLTAGIARTGAGAVQQ